MAWLKWPYFFQVLLNGDASRTGKAGSAPGPEMASMAAPNVDYKLWCQSLQVELFCFFSKSPGWNPKMYVHNNLRMNERITRFFYTDTYTICIRNRNSCSHHVSSILICCVMSHKEASLSAMIFEPVLLSHRREVHPQFTIISHHVSTSTKSPFPLKHSYHSRWLEWQTPTCNLVFTRAKLHSPRRPFRWKSQAHLVPKDQIIEEIMHPCLQPYISKYYAVES